MIPVSTAMWDPKWFHDFTGDEDYIFKDKRGIYNGIRASIFLMTSVCEGLPMTILEAQQCGCVPILYDSFASARDVIVNEKNGILIENREKKTYVAKLKELMSNEDLRQMMSNACVELSSRFSLETIANQWNELLHCL